MKTKYLYTIMFLLAALVFVGCKKMDSTYKEYIVPGGITYTGKPAKAVAASGYKRIKISWLRAADPNVAKAKVFWDNYTDSLEVDIPPTGDTISVTINNLVEKAYSFMIINYDENGVPSIPVELISAAYADKYQSQLLNRPVNSLTIKADGEVVINWGSADISKGAFKSEIKYTNTSGQEVIKQFPVNEPTTSLTDLKSGSRFEYRTIFKPDSISIDQFYTGYVESDIMTIDKKDWKVIDFSSHHDTGVNSVNNFIDGTDGTRWHSLANGTPYPHFATIDMGVERTITQFGLWRTTFENGGDARAPDKIQLLVSTDNVEWNDLGEFNFNRMINGEQTIKIPSQPRARYIKFIAVQGPENNMVMGEISAYGL